MSENLYVNGYAHTPIPRGPHCVSTSDLTAEGEDAVLLRLYYPTPAGDGKGPVMDPQQWANWHLGKEYFEGFVQFITSSSNYSRIILPALRPVLYLYGYCLTNMKIPVQWCKGLLARESSTQVTSQGQGNRQGEGQGWPVIVTSHGMANNRSTHSTLASDFASHGFVVASIEHREGSACASFHVDPTSKEKKWMKYTAYRHTDQLDIRINEMFSCVSVLERLNSGELRNLMEHESPVPLNTFRNQLDLSNLILMGHSYGGSSVLKALADSRNCFRCGVVLDPWMFPIRTVVKDIGGSIKTPLISISTEEFNKGPNRKALHLFQEALSGTQKSSSVFYTMNGTCHHHGNDSPWVSGRFGWWVTAGTYGHHPQTIHRLQCNMILSFIDKHIDTSRDNMYSSHSWLPQYREYIEENRHILIINGDQSGV